MNKEIEVFLKATKKKKRPTNLSRILIQIKIHKIIKTSMKLKTRKKINHKSS